MTLHPSRVAHSFQEEFRGGFEGKRVMVTGATGFVGTNLCRALRSVGAEVTGVALADSLLHAPDPDGILAADLTDETSARSMVEAIQPEMVFHLAGMVDTRQSTDLVLPTLVHNLVGTVHLMTALVGTGCQRVLVVTSSETPRVGQTPNSPYAASKLAMVSYAEMYWTLFGLPVVIARPHMVFGPYQPPDKLIPYLIRCGLENTPPRLASGARLCDPVYVKDFVRALLHMATADGALGMTLDVGTGVGLSVAEIAGRVLALTGSTKPPVFGAIPDRLGEAPQVADLTSTQAVLTWRPAWSFDEAVRETIDWYAAQSDLLPGGHQSTRREVPE